MAEGRELSWRDPPQEKKIFTVQGPYPVIRRLLWARGWVERKLPGVGSWPQRQRVSQEKQQQEKGDDGAEQRGTALDPQPGSSRLVRDQVPYFIWTNRCDAVDRRLLRQDQLVNHYARVGAFTTKDGLCLNLRNLPWFDQADPDTFFPRCYRLGAVDDRQAFIGEFRAGVNPPRLSPSCCPHPLCSWFPRAQRVPWSHVPHPMPSTAGPETPLSPQLVEEALQVCGQHLGSLGHQDIDGDPHAEQDAGDRAAGLALSPPCVPPGSDKARLVLSGAQRERGRALLRCLAERLPQLGMEGDHNVWILKPGAKSRGRGIVCVARLEEVLRLAGGCVAPVARAGKWVVQKYVERPLLIFGTKFDIRQWFLVTDWNPLTVWFYRESYLRFCSQPFCLHHLDPARHLCNVSIQKQCRPARGQHPQLPPDQIWSCQQLQAYLAQVGRAGAWDQVMVPGMKAAVVGALRSAQDQVGSRKGSFELYGADFVFGEDCQPWLLEINASPTMAPSSAVTSRLCASVQRDMLRVVIDRRDNPACPTGAFELIYKEVRNPSPHSTDTRARPPRLHLLPPSPLCPPTPGAEPPGSPSGEQRRGSCLLWGDGATAAPPDLPPQHHHSPQSAVPGAGGCGSSAACSGSLRQLCRSSVSVPWPGHPSPYPKESPAAPGDPRTSLPPPPLLPRCCAYLDWHPAPGPRAPAQGSRALLRRGGTGQLRGGRRRAVRLQDTQEGPAPCLRQHGGTQQHPTPARPHRWVGAPSPHPAGAAKHVCDRKPGSDPPSVCGQGQGCGQELGQLLGWGLSAGRKRHPRSCLPEPWRGRCGRAPVLGTRSGTGVTAGLLSPALRGVCGGVLVPPAMLWERREGCI
uniref:Tubulin monoglycylase TTLL3 n=1 Tax=Otus sunia TaxID=257818 RepID=A0A8C8AN86_9STRI